MKTSISPFLHRSIETDPLSLEISSFVHRFTRIVKHHVLFHVLAISLLGLELLLFALFFTYLANSSLLALSLAAIFLTLFSYLILRVSLQGKKPEQFQAFVQEFVTKCEESNANHLALANACCKLATALQGEEYRLYSPPAFLQPITSIMEKVSCFLHWENFHMVKESLLLASVRKNIELVKEQPTSLEFHATLANAYVMLSTLYKGPTKQEVSDDDRWVSKKIFSDSFKEKFHSTAKRAMEEFKILQDFSPSDPWVHSQLAYSYHDLQMPDEEIREYETILKLRPDDLHTLFKLGRLYFSNGHEAKGLQSYESLKIKNPKLAEKLIHHYGDYTLH